MYIGFESFLKIIFLTCNPSYGIIGVRMTDNVDYEELVEKTISEIKEEIDKEGMDLKKVLSAEKDNKNRKTLKQWLENKIEDPEETAEKDSEEKEKAKKEKKKENIDKKPEIESAVDKGVEPGFESPWKKPSTNLLLGILIGVAVTALLMYTPQSEAAVPDGISGSEASKMAENYLQDQLGEQQGINISVSGVNEEDYSDIYVVGLSVDSDQGSQSIDVYVTKQSGLMFLGPLAGAQPIDLEEGTPVGNVAAEPTGAK